MLLLPPKRLDIEPPPAVVDEVKFEESDIVDVRNGTFPASSDFFDHGFTSQFGGEAEDDWEDEEDDEEGGMPAPECRHQ